MVYRVFLRGLFSLSVLGLLSGGVSFSASTPENTSKNVRFGLPGTVGGQHSPPEEIRREPAKKENHGESASARPSDSRRQTDAFLSNEYSVNDTHALARQQGDVPYYFRSAPDIIISGETVSPTFRNSPFYVPPSVEILRFKAF